VNRVSTPRFSPVWLVLVGILSVQFGAVVSKGLFGEIPPVGMVFLRLITSSLILLAFVRRGCAAGRSPTGGRCWRWGSRSAR
jgi:threonine/homoserine efflux transporter RhtA